MARKTCVCISLYTYNFKHCIFHLFVKSLHNVFQVLKAKKKSLPDSKSIHLDTEEKKNEQVPDEVGYHFRYVVISRVPFVKANVQPSLETWNSVTRVWSRDYSDVFIRPERATVRLQAWIWQIHHATILDNHLTTTLFITHFMIIREDSCLRLQRADKIWGSVKLITFSVATVRAKLSKTTLLLHYL